MSATQLTDSVSQSIATLLSYGFVAAVILAGWYWSDQQFIYAQDGVGYWLGIAGTTCMAVLLLYPLRKRVKRMHSWGPVSYWFRTHMFLGVVGPTLIIFHSNYSLGSLNSKVALFCTLVVATSGLFGRYFYSKLHLGLYGQKTSLLALRDRIASHQKGKGISGLLPEVNDRLVAWEDKVLARESGVGLAFVNTIQISFEAWLKYRQINRFLNHQLQVPEFSARLGDEQREQLRIRAQRYLKHRILLVRKYAQFRTFERLFSLWHIVHYPLFVFMVVAVIIHIVAVHMY